MDYLTVGLGAALLVSEALSLIPQVKSNGLFQSVWNILKVMGGRPTTKND